jgi:hypothetical protein
VKEENAEISSKKRGKCRDEHLQISSRPRPRTSLLLQYNSCRENAELGFISAEEARALYSPILMMQRRLSPLAIRSNAVLISENGTL